MDAKKHLEVALGGNMNIQTLTPLAFTEIMKDYAKVIASHLYEKGMKDGKSQVSRGFDFHYDNLLFPNKNKEEDQFIIELNKQNN